MSDTEVLIDRRAEIARRNRRRAAEARERKLSMATFGLMACSAFGNLLTGVVSFFKTPIDACFALALALFMRSGHIAPG